MYKLDEIILTKDERKAMRKVSHYDSIPTDRIKYNVVRSLVSFGLLSENYCSEVIDGKVKLDGTISATDKYERYKRHRFDLFITGKFTTFIALVALISSFRTEILSLLQWLIKLL